MRKMIIALLIVLMLIPSLTFGVSANAADDSADISDDNFVIGNVNGDADVNIKDATAIQKHLVDLIRLSESVFLLIDTDGDGKINIKDATVIQKFIADIPVLNCLIGQKPQPVTPETVVTECAEVEINGNVYYVPKGETFTYEVSLYADRVCENVQASVNYDSDVLELVRLKSDDPDVADWEVEAPVRCPNLDGAVFNADFENEVRFNASRISGYNFKEEKVLVTLEFTVKEAEHTEIDFDMQFLTIKGDSSEMYFYKGQPMITEGIEIKENIRTAAEYAGIDINGEMYAVPKGKVFTYEVSLYADRLCENVQAIVNYDPNVLELVRLKSDDPDVADWEIEGPVRCPNLDGAVFNADFENEVRFNASRISGYNFKEEKVLVTLEFTVKEAKRAEIDFLMQFLTIKGEPSQMYFYDGQPVITDGIEIKEVVF